MRIFKVGIILICHEGGNRCEMLKKEVSKFWTNHGFRGSSEINKMTVITLFVTMLLCLVG